MENDPRYNSTLSFETFPFPAGLTPPSPALPPMGEGSLTAHVKIVVASFIQPMAE
jgi:hypothetical protein